MFPNWEFLFCLHPTHRNQYPDELTKNKRQKTEPDCAPITVAGGMKTLTHKISVQHKPFADKNADICFPF
jgi:hypothetical protein